MAKQQETHPTTNGEVAKLLDRSAFKALLRDLDIMRKEDVADAELENANVSDIEAYWENQLNLFAFLVNQELDDYLKKSEAQISSDPARRTIDYANRIEKAAKNLRKLILAAPPAIKKVCEFERLESDLEQIPDVLRGLKAVDQFSETGIGLEYSSSRKERIFRSTLILRVHSLYEQFTTQKDWYTSDPNEENERYSTPFFQILRLCYSAIGLDLADTTIESDITQAIAWDNLEDVTDEP